MAVTFGYARVPTSGQSLDAQRDALHTAGVDARHVHVETASGRRADRPVLAALLAQLLQQQGDALLVIKLNRLGGARPIGSGSSRNSSAAASHCAR